MSSERFDALTNPHFVIKKGGTRGNRHGKSEAQRENHQAKPNEEFCKQLNEIAQEDHSYVATWQERRRYEKGGSYVFTANDPWHQ